MPKKNPEQWISENERAAQSVARVTNLLSKYFPLDGIEETTPFGEEDREGVDLILFPTKEFSDLTDCAIIQVQVKSSETGLNGFLEKGKQLNGLRGGSWREKKLIVLDGQWAETTLVADFVAQLANLRGVLNNPFEMEGFLSALDPYPQQCFRRATAQGLLDQYRGDLYKWVSSPAVKVR